MELKPASDFQILFWEYGPVVVGVYFWFLFTFAISVCGWAFGKTKKKAYLFVAVFFVSPFFGAVMEQISRQIHKEEYQRMKEQMIQEDEAKRARGELIVVESEVSYPLFETFLVLGIFLHF